MKTAADLILLVEDNSSDAMAVELAFRSLPKRFQLYWVSNGTQAIEYLSGAAAYSERQIFPLPRLVLLDLMMPGMDGFEVLEWIRQQPEFKNLPVIVLATSSTSPDVTRAYNSGANSFISKPPNLQTLVRELQTALEYWVPEPGLPAPIRQVPPPAQITPMLGETSSKTEKAENGPKHAA